MQLESWQWVLAAMSAMLVGFSKTGMPTAGILFLPLMAYVLGGRQSVGAVLPMLIFADIFAVILYRRSARWDKLGILVPWIVIGMAIGAWVILALGDSQAVKDPFNLIIGIVVLLLLTLTILKDRIGKALQPDSKFGVVATGTLAGFSTTLSNGAGPIMSLYFNAINLTKSEFVGTSAWFFCLVNLAKLPIYIAISVNDPTNPMITGATLWFDLVMIPAILVGVFVGKWFLPRIDQAKFSTAVLCLAGIGALFLIFG